MSTGITIVGVLVILGGIYKLLVGKSTKLVQLQVQATQVEQQIAANDAARADIKETITAQQANATEDQKSQFWTKELEDKKNE